MGVDYSYYGFSKNPFTLDILAETFTGYGDQKDAVLDAISSNEKYVAVIGESGFGKTTFASWLKSYLQDYDVYYLPKPLKSSHDLTRFLAKIRAKQSLFGLFSRMDYDDPLNKLREFKKPTILIIDEFHESSDEFVEWVRSFVDHILNLYVVLLYQPEYEDILKLKHFPLYNRITTRVILDGLNKNEVHQLIKKRIEYFGGRGIDPFTSDFISYIVESTKGKPREIIKLCSYYLKEGAKRKVEIIDLDFVRSLTSNEDVHSPSSLLSDTFINVDTSSKDDFSRSSISNNVENTKEQIFKKSDILLTNKQKEILELIKSKGALTPPEIVDAIDTSEYKSKLHALRAINNILRRLEQLGYLKRERLGRRYVYTYIG